MYIYLIFGNMNDGEKRGRMERQEEDLDVNINNIIYERHLEKCMIMCVSVQTGKESINHIKILYTKFLNKNVCLVLFLIFGNRGKHEFLILCYFCFKCCVRCVSRLFFLSFL